VSTGGLILVSAIDPKEHSSQTELFWGACVLKRAGFSDEEAEHVLRAKFYYYYRPMDDREFERAIANCDPSVPATGTGWPLVDPKQVRKALSLSSGGVDLLKSRSPIANPHLLSPGAVIDRLFDPSALLCLGRTKKDVETESREFFRNNEEEFQFIVPNPMLSKEGLTTDNLPSKRCLTNVGPLTYQVIEFDSGSQDEQANLLMHLAGFGFDLRAVAFSGGKSLHGWFGVAGLPSSVVHKFREYARVIGADKAMFIPCQFARLPNGTRDTGEQQTCLFLR
jgi:hypothetical protein